MEIDIRYHDRVIPVYFQLALFNKWDEELQQRKAELAEKIENLSESAKNALEEWRAIRQEVCTNYKEVWFGWRNKFWLLLGRELRALCHFRYSLEVDQFFCLIESHFLLFAFPNRLPSSRKETSSLVCPRRSVMSWERSAITGRDWLPLQRLLLLQLRRRRLLRNHPRHRRHLQLRPPLRQSRLSRLRLRNLWRRPLLWVFLRYRINNIYNIHIQLHRKKSDSCFK